jgi:hypothetical protein
MRCRGKCQPHPAAALGAIARRKQGYYGRGERLGEVCPLLQCLVPAPPVGRWGNSITVSPAISEVNCLEGRNGVSPCSFSRLPGCPCGGLGGGAASPFTIHPYSSWSLWRQLIYASTACCWAAWVYAWIPKPSRWCMQTPVADGSVQKGSGPVGLPEN